MINVLVFPCGTEIGLEIYRALKYSKKFKVYGANSISDHSEYVYQNYIPNIPNVESSDFISEINKVILENNISFIIPAHDSVVLKLSENKKLVQAEIVGSEYETCKISRSKFLTYKKFKNLLPTPKIYTDQNNLKFPLFLKPDIGQGSKGTYFVSNIDDLNFYLDKDQSLLTLEYLPGKEYTIDCFTNKNGQLQFCEGRERIRIQNGISVRSKLINNYRFKELGHIINKALIFRGAWFFQVKENINGELTLMEIAPRIAGTMELFRIHDVNFIELALLDRLGEELNILFNQNDIIIDRALESSIKFNYEYDKVYIDLDDTIIINNQVNPEAIKFLYSSRNKGNTNILITKHTGNLRYTFKKFCIDDHIFDQVFYLTTYEQKSKYIDKDRSIFIDDSFKERKEVYDKLGIPVFGVDAIKYL